MATENPEEPSSFQAKFMGLNAAIDMYDTPLGQWQYARNLLTMGREGYMRTRNGYKPASAKVEAEPFAIMSGIEGGLIIVVPGDPTKDDLEGDFVMSLKQDPNDTNSGYYVTKEAYKGYQPFAMYNASAMKFIATTFGGTELGMANGDYDWLIDELWGVGSLTVPNQRSTTGGDSTKSFTVNLITAQGGNAVGKIIDTIKDSLGNDRFIWYRGRVDVTVTADDSNGDARTITKRFYVLQSPQTAGGTEPPVTPPPEEPPVEPEEPPVTVDPPNIDGEDPPPGDTTDGDDPPGVTPPGGGTDPDEPDVPPVVPPEPGDPDDPDKPKVNRRIMVVTAPPNVLSGEPFAFTIQAKEIKSGAFVALPGVPFYRGYIPTENLPGINTASSYYTGAKYMLDTTQALLVWSESNTKLTVNNVIFRLPSAPEDVATLVLTAETVISASITGDSDYIQGGCMPRVALPIPTISTEIQANPREYAGITSANNYSATLLVKVTQTAPQASTGTYTYYDIGLYGAGFVGGFSAVSMDYCCPGETWVEAYKVALTTMGPLKAIPLSVFATGLGYAVVKMTVTWTGTAPSPSTNVWPWYLDDHWTGVSVYAVTASYLGQQGALFDDHDAFDINKSDASGMGFARSRQVLLGAQYGQIDLGENYESVDETGHKLYLCAGDATWYWTAKLYDPDHAPSQRLSGFFANDSNTYSMASGTITKDSSGMWEADGIPKDQFLTSVDDDDEMATPLLGARSVPVYVYSSSACITTTFDLYRACDSVTYDTYDTYRVCPTPS